MAKGPAFLLKIGNGDVPQTYATIAGMRVIEEGRTPERMSLSASGIFTGSAAEQRLKQNALSGVVDDYELHFETGEQLRGRFMVTRLDYADERFGERTYALGIVSAGPIDAVGAQAIASTRQSSADPQTTGEKKQ